MSAAAFYHGLALIAVVRPHYTESPSQCRERVFAQLPAALREQLGSARELRYESVSAGIDP
jgi:hypothetical protein